MVFFILSMNVFADTETLDKNVGITAKADKSMRGFSESSKFLVLLAIASVTVLLSVIWN